MEQTKQLNAGQQAAADGFFKFLMSDEPELIISGPGGVGKTFLMSYLIDTVLPNYHDMCSLLGMEEKYNEVVMTATTNKAADVLGVATNRPTQTIHSFLNLRVTEDFTSGLMKLVRTNKWEVHQQKIIFIDECSMINRDLKKFIDEGTANCKIIYVGDHCQLAPVMEKLSPIYQKNLPFFELTEPMRNAESPALMNLCNQLRNTVETGEFLPIQIIPGVIDHIEDDGLELLLDEDYKEDQPLDKRILAYSNNRVVAYNDYIREIRNQSYLYDDGETLINNSGVNMNGTIVGAEMVCTVIKNHGEEVININGIGISFQKLDLQTVFGAFTDILVPSNRDHFMSVMKYYAKNKMWPEYFDLKNNYPDLRPFDSATVHKSQGSTYTSVLIDLTNISTCNIPDQVARMLYVAVSRAKTRVILYGNLKKAYGGIIK